MIVSPRDYVFFTIDKEYADKLRTPSGFELDLVIAGDPGQKLHHVREFGTVVSVPRSLSSWLNTTIDLRVGDKIYFHFHTVDEENKQQIAGKNCYKVHYGEIYCAIRGGETIMLNDYVFCQPVMETEDDIKTASGIYLKLEPEPVPLRARVVHLPRGKQDRELSIGEEIYYKTHSDVPIEVEGVKYYRMRRGDIIAKYITPNTEVA